MLLGTTQSGNGTFSEYLKIPEDGLNQFVLEVVGSLNASIDDVSVIEVGILKLTVQQGLLLAPAVSLSQAGSITLAAKTTLALQAAVSASIAPNLSLSSVSPMVLQNAVSLSKVDAITLTPASWLLSIAAATSASTADNIVLNFNVSPVLGVVDAVSLSQVDAIVLAPTTALIVAATTSVSLATVPTLTLKYALGIQPATSISFATTIPLFGSILPQLSNRKKVRIKWLDWRNPAVFDGHV